MRAVQTKLIGIILLGFCIVSITIPASGQESESTGITMEALAGFDGYYKSGSWTPVIVTVANNGTNMEARLRISVGDDADEEVVYSKPIILPTQSKKRHTLIVHLPEILNNLSVELVSENDQILHSVRTNTLQRLERDQLLYAIITNEPGVLASLENTHGDRSDASVAYLDMINLPIITSAWSSLDVLVIHNVDSMNMTSSQIGVLHDWIEVGGQLVVTGGPSWRKNIEAFDDLLPVAVIETISREDLPNLRERSGVPFRDAGPYLVASSTLREGRLLWHQNGLPILATRTLGRGSVHFLALDPDLAPLVDWDGADQIWSDIVSYVPNQPLWAEGPRDAAAATNAVSALPSLVLPSTLHLFLFLVAYVTIVGPLNYLVLKKRGHRELAWLTIPIIVIFFTIIAYMTGFRLKGNVTISNQMSVAYGRVGDQRIKVQTLVGLYSPRRATYEMELPFGTMIRPFERRYGSLTGSGRIGEIVQDQETTVTSTRVDVGDMETFLADSYQDAPEILGSATMINDETGLKVNVSIQNNSDYVLDDATILLGSKGVKLGNLEPGSYTQVSEPIDSSLGVFSASKPTGPIPAGTSLSANYDLILGSVDFFADQDVYPRWQLLEALAPQFIGASANSSTDKAYLIAWSGESQLDLNIEGANSDSLSTTLYILELGLNQDYADSGSVVVPKQMLNWRVLSESGVFNPSIDELHLATGWVDFEYEPWPLYQEMNVSKLEIVINKAGTYTGQPVPQLFLWNWGQELWTAVDNLEWGVTEVKEPLPYLGTENIIRIRLQNDSTLSLDILEIYPLIEGELTD